METKFKVLLFLKIQKMMFIQWTLLSIGVYYFMLLVLLSLLLFVEIRKGYKNSVLLVIFERF